MSDNGEVLKRIDGLRTEMKTDFGTVHSRISKLSADTGEFKLEVTKTLAKIEQIETTCPIRDVQVTLRDCEATAKDAKREARRISALIAAGISAIGAAIAAAIGWRN